MSAAIWTIEPDAHDEMTLWRWESPKDEAPLAVLRPSDLPAAHRDEAWAFITANSGISAPPVDPTTPGIYLGVDQGWEGVVFIVQAGLRLTRWSSVGFLSDWPEGEPWPALRRAEAVVSS